jgi:hypothetical protein
MDEKRSGKKRRSRKDQRKGGTSSYNGPERRSLKFGRSDIDRRKKRETDKIQ